ncbi:DUF2281 domain-containing protein [Truepera radiovictrix]|uniref:DUF2281 domain-containing protein n=1 Tax=Truepera radiovictrix (strain DSM 17093 / CIP 108686 / LMG 22925 / RQ-24) TaxID=649638 RepID=D7CQJ5_TRURR|nr:DUF2281 domain-containing protein [Truepera radiovictrix]ADI14979.1 conserved hypothetical protein [Truepera radiovictrix DSM 17093]WMT56466.1 DUF2281 domain-containing protein [Truepera radiovictrix]
MTTVPLKEAKERLEELLAEGAFMVRLDDGSVWRLEVKPLAGTSERRGGFGRARGWFTMSKDFDEPLEDFREYWE